ncbi:ABC transporter permease [Enterobacter sp. Ap-916]|uniref:ABC transporter permease n=1 Tax=Enterobacteriaceae TaxID=543 RepID=UPI000272A9B9|nr:MULTISPECIES: ABC transporter permease [Enterobacteriaceae]AJZ88100.1 ABC transporter permease [Klebsiella michiganensis]EJF29907.1 binding-protein-dependent transport system inner membrane protein [Enterobacter sp. Ag1]NIF48840.1 ABC transporter permease [Enterobacter sp. Ap-1006]NIF58583.1 ABC transporter permease [Enterobacter sp. Ap-867]NIG30257.1 ABC transporter permease [Enterobacter sp. Ap-916]
MKKQILHRLLLGVLTLWLVSVLIFVGTELLPGDVASAILGQNGTPETIAALRLQLGLDQPAVYRYLHWLSGVLHGDLGTSLANNQPIGAELLPRLANTLFLALYAALIAIPLAVVLGIASAVWRGSWFDRLANTLTLMSISVPEFFVGYVLVIFFAIRLAWFPSLALVDPDASLLDRLYACTLPMLTLVLVVLAHMLRMTRASVGAVMSSSYIETALLKGLSRWRIVLSHALPNALAPIINVIAFNLAYLVVGVILVEVVFVYPGIGQLMVDAVTKRDLPVVQACGLLFGGTYILLNTAADLLAIWCNPRLRHAR